MLILCLVLASAETSPDKTLAPYFQVEGAEPGVERLPLKDTHVDVAISGVVAEVMVTQTYMNDGNVPVHARYVFPGSTRAAVNGLKMIVGEEIIVAKIKERETAKREFDAAKTAGKSASLLTQERPNVFTMNVANVLPHDTIRVELTYTELLVPTDGVYQFVFPTVVGPRYSHTTVADASPLDQFVVTPFLHEGAPSPVRFTLEATVSSGMPLQDVRSPTHAITIAARTTDSVSLGLSPLEASPGTKDFILEYTMQDARVQSGLLAYEGKDESYFVLMAEPPKRVVKDMITPREYIFVLDVSGSMYGFPLNTAKTLMSRLLADLRPYETFNVVLFSGRAYTMAETSVPATEDNIRAAMGAIDGQQGSGGTELFNALRTAFAIPKSEGVARTMVVVTDGYIAEEREAFDFIRDNLSATNVFAFGIGSSVNRHLIEGVAHAGMGEPFVVTQPNEAPAAAEKFREYVVAPVLTGVALATEGVEVYDLEPKTIPDVFAARPVVVTGKYRGKGTITLRGHDGSGEYTRAFTIAEGSPNNRAIRQLWARARLVTISDFHQGMDDEATHDAIVDVGLTYNLLTKYTSFIAVHEKVRTTTPGQDVDQPQPLPDGVSDRAVGGGVTSGAEPSLIVLLVMVAFFLSRRKLA